MAVLKIFDGTKWVAARSVVVPGVCSTASATAAKVVTINDYTPTPGDILAITFTNGNSAASPTLNINGTGAKNIRLGTTNASTTTFKVGAGAQIMLLFDGTYYNLTGSYRTSDSNTHDRTQLSAIQVGDTVQRYKLLMEGVDGKYYPLTLENSTGVTKTVSTADFKIGGNIVYYNSTTQLAPDATTTSCYSEIPTAYAGYTFNQLTGYQAHRPIYLKGTIANGVFKLDNSSYTSWFTQDLPTSEDGFVYVYVGYMYSTNDDLRLMQYHPMYEFKDGRVRLYVPEHTHSDYIVSSQLNAALDDYLLTSTAASTYVPKTLKINNKALSDNINLNASDVGAVPTTRTVNGKALSNNINLSASDVGALPSTGTAADSSKLNGQSPSYYLNYNNLTNKPSYSTQAQAEAGTSTTGIMSPLRVKQAIDKFAAPIGDYALKNSDNNFTAKNTFNDELIINDVENFNNVYLKKVLGLCNVTTTYANLPEEIKNGGYHRVWKISFPTGVNFWGKIKIHLYGGYSSFNASGKMAKEINVNFNGASMYSNVGYYTELSGFVEKDFRISEAIWNSETSQWEFWIYSDHLNGNNAPFIYVEGWARGTNYVNSFKGLTLNTTAEFRQDTTYQNVKGNAAGQTLTKNWGDLPTYQNPYGQTIATIDNITDLTASDVGAVPTTRTVNGKALSNNISLTASDVGALPSTGTAVDSSKLNGQSPSYYLNYNNLTNKPTIPTGVVSGVCSTSAATAAKVVTISGYTPTPGDILAITFTNGTTASTPTLNINGTGAKNIRLGSNNASSTTLTVGAGGVVMMYYTGTHYQLMGSHRISDSTVSAATQAEVNNGDAVAKYVRPDYLKIMLDGKGYQTEAQVDAKISDYDQYISSMILSQGYQTAAQVQDAIIDFQDLLMNGDIEVWDAANARWLYNLNEKCEICGGDGLIGNQPGSDIGIICEVCGGTGFIGGALRLWKGTQAQYDALPSATKNNANFIFFIKG